MCGRVTLISPADAIAAAFSLRDVPLLTPRWNIAPSQMLLAIRTTPAAPSAAAMLRWGLIPHWASDPSIADRLINARSETADIKPAFREAFRLRRCLIVVDGYYEWRKPGPNDAGRIAPVHIRPAQGGLMALAGLWDAWKTPTGETLESCTVLTTAANRSLSPVHDRMPVVLHEGSHRERWLREPHEDAASLKSLCAPAPEGWLIANPVGPYVNNPRHEGAECLSPPAAGGDDAWAGPSLFDRAR